MQDNQIMPASLQDKLEMANIFIRSNLMPRGFDRPEKIVIALELGHELGLPPLIAIMNIAVINNQPTLKADMMVALALRSGKVADLRITFQGNDDDFGCIVFLKRKDIESPFTSSFTRRDAKVAGLYSKDNWQKYERRMLKHRAIAFCVRDALPEIFSGIYLPEEIEDVYNDYPEEDRALEGAQSLSGDTPQSNTHETPVLENDISEKVTPQQVKAIRSLAGRLLPPGTLESYLYANYEVNRVEQLTADKAGEIILLLQNEPEKIRQWLDASCSIPAGEAACM